MLVGDDLPKFGTDLVTALSCWVEGEGGREDRVVGWGGQGSCRMVCAMMPELTAQGDERGRQEKVLLAQCAIKK